MDIKFLNYDPPIVLLENIYSDESLEKINAELNALKYVFTDDGLGSAEYDDGTPLAKKTGVFLGHVYNKEEYSSILIEGNIIRKILERLSDHWYFRLNYTDLVYNTLVSYYDEGDKYDKHIDNTVISFISWYTPVIKNFKGGELIIPDYNLTIECKNNTGVIIPGNVYHEVAPVSIIDNTVKYGGRFSISQFINHALI